MMDVVNRFLIVTLLIGLVSAQINFSTSWGKRSPSSVSATDGLSSLPRRHPVDSRTDSTGPLQSSANIQQQQTLPEPSYRSSVYSSSSEIDDEQPTVAQLPSPCLSLLKSLLLINKIVEVCILFPISELLSFLTLFKW